MVRVRHPRQVGLLSGARALVAAALLLPVGAAARPTLGLRLGWAPAVGSAASRVPMSEELRWQLPLQLDALWRFGSLGAGAYASWGAARAGTEACADGAACSAQVLRAGAQGAWTFPPWSFGAAPWLGAGAGWEWASRRRERLGASATTRWDGPELAVQGGAEWRLGRRFAVGPFAVVALGRYAGIAVETSVESASASIGERAVHAWIQLGARGTIDF